MQRQAHSLLTRFAAPLAAVAVLAGCSTMDVKPKTEKAVEALKTGPQARPHRTITNFSTSLRCMDNVLIDYGVRDLSTLVEEIVDQTKKVNAGTRDMLISAMSEMTRRSRAVRVVAFGKDAGNAVSFLQAAQRQGAYQVVPTFDIKGSVSQFDENLARTQKDFGLSLQPFLNLGVSRDAAASILGLDLSVLLTEDMSVLSGVTSRNSVVIFRQGKGTDGDAAYHKFGISYSMTFNQSEGQSQALRGLVELAVIELVGKLTKTPYWKCLGADSKDPEVQAEVGDWYYAMAANGGELIAWFQNQLRARRFYDGPVDGRFNPAIDEAIAAYRAELGMSREPVIEQAFFRAFLDADHSKVKAPAQPARHEPKTAAETPAVAPAAAAAPAPAATPPAVTASASAPRAALQLKVQSSSQQTHFARGELVDLQINASRAAYLYCYLQDERAQVRRVYPNRFVRSAFVPAGTTVELPGNQRFQIVMNNKGVAEAVICLATDLDVSARLPAAAFGKDFDALPVTSFAQIRDAFLNVSGGPVAQETFNVQPK